MKSEDIKKLVKEAISEEVGELKDDITKLQKEDEQTEENTEAELTAEDIKSTIAKTIEESLKPIQEDVDSLKKNTKRSKDPKSTRLNSSHVSISYAVFCLKKKIKKRTR